jgi:hypothetical protein
MPQHLDALAQANRVRLGRSALKQQIRDGEITVQQVLAAPPPEALTMTLSALLMAQHRWSTIRARRLCKALMIGELRPVGTLTPRERGRIDGMLRYANPESVEWAA